MVEKFTRLTHKIATRLQLVAESCTILATSGQSGKFWIHPRSTFKCLLPIAYNDIQQKTFR